MSGLLALFRIFLRLFVRSPFGPCVLAAAPAVHVRTRPFTMALAASTDRSLKSDYEFWIHAGVESFVGRSLRSNRACPYQ